MTAFSDVIVLTASPDSDISLPTNTASSQNSEDRLIFKSLAWRNRISYFIANTKGNFDSFHRVAKVTLGDVFYMDPADLNGPLTVDNSQPLINKACRFSTPSCLLFLLQK